MNQQKNSFAKIYEVVAKIPKGTVATYGQVARLAGNPRWSRVVGYALNVVPENSELPCYRVVNREGRVSAAFGLGEENLQIRMLEEDGIPVENDCVDLKKYQWVPEAQVQNVMRFSDIHPEEL